MITRAKLEELKRDPKVWDYGPTLVDLRDMLNTLSTLWTVAEAAKKYVNKEKGLQPLRDAIAALEGK